MSYFWPQNYERADYPHWLERHFAEQFSTSASTGIVVGEQNIHWPINHNFLGAEPWPQNHWFYGGVATTSTGLLGTPDVWWPLRYNVIGAQMWPVYYLPMEGSTVTSAIKDYRVYMKGIMTWPR